MIVIIPSMDEKMMLMVDEERKFGFKLVLFIQIMITCVIIQASYGFLLGSSVEIVEMLINIPALLFLNDIKDYIGKRFK